jgi:hypothetical protein
MNESQQVSDAEVLEQVTKLELFYKARGDNNAKSFTQLYDEAEALLLKRKRKLVVSNTSSSLPTSPLALPSLPPSPRSCIDDDEDDDTDEEDLKLVLKLRSRGLSSLTESSASSKPSTTPSTTHINIIKNRGNVTFYQSVSVIDSFTLSIYLLHARSLSYMLYRSGRLRLMFANFICVHECCMCVDGTQVII